MQKNGKKKKTPNNDSNMFVYIGWGSLYEVFT